MSARTAYYGMAILTLVNFVNYIDRFILAAVLPSIQADLKLTDLDAGLLGNGFLIAYFVTSPLFGRLGDRLSRTRLISAGIAIWSAATASAGLAKNFVQLLGARSAVGIGEASYATISPSLISDYFPKDRRGRVFAMFYVAIPVGAAVGYLLGGALEEHFGWRTAFFIVGLPGLAFAALALTTADPPRGIYDDEPVEEQPALKESLRTLARNRVYVWTVLGYSAYTFAVGGLGLWMPKYLFLVRGLTLKRADDVVGMLTVVGGLGGTFLGGYLGDKLLTRTKHAYLYVSAGSMLLAVPAAVVAFMAQPSAVYLTALFIAEFLAFMSTGPINVVIVNVVPVTLRASAVAVSIFTIHLLGDMTAQPLIGVVSDHFGLDNAMMLVPVAILLCSILWFVATLPRNVSRQQA